MSPPAKKLFVPKNPNKLTDEELELFLEMSDEEDMISGKSDSESDSDIYDCDHSNSDNEELHFDHQGANNNGLHPSSLSPSTSRQSQHSPLHATTTISDNDDASFDHQGATNYLSTSVSASSKTSRQSQSSSPITSLSARARTTPSLVDYSSDSSDSDYQPITPSPKQAFVCVTMIHLYIYVSF